MKSHRMKSSRIPHVFDASKEPVTHIRLVETELFDQDDIEAAILRVQRPFRLDDYEGGR